ncbi:Retrovirus-related Pol polyprotein from transposon TNT 1-94 [Sesamum angolense]|uniref:Retrovirus-related Pol polyprotein from transposon TNT 1-94 n=1 Tax=Sesamum angolense TaxID=2727404 RepID=A0AAE2C7H9_9LAMI|nr:Retrovirus-related Pol polyprotein from transposon TNT 1-94 [Sesamum angolense]
MDQPEGFQKIGLKRKVCRLKCSIYGLKQSSRKWYYRFHRAITSIGFTMIEEDRCVYVKRSVKNFFILSSYVDDILLVGKNMEMIVATQKWLSSTFEIKDMEENEYILGVKIHRDRSKKLLSLSQETYIKRITERFRMHNANPVDTPMDKSCVLSKELCPKTEEEKKRMTKIPYASAVGSLMYAMMCTRPDLCFAVGMVSRYQSNPGPDHWVAVKRILRYLKGTTAIVYAKDPKYHGRTKHIDTRYHFIRDSIAQGEVVLRHIPTNDMIADPFTKPLRRDAFHRHALIDTLTWAITLAL